MKQRELLGSALDAERRCAGEIAARLVHAGDQPELHGVARDAEYYGDRRCCRLRRESRGGASEHGDHCRLAADKVRRERRQAVVMSLSPTIFDPDITTFCIADL